MDDGGVTEADERMWTGVCPIQVKRALMIHRWDRLTFLHWRYDPAVIQALLPEGLTVETFDGSAWVGLVPFEMVVRAPRAPSVPWASRFPETNVRTYVTAPDGTTGVWFLSLDAARFGAVAIARAGFDLPYYWSSMDISQVGPVMTYRSMRRWPQPAPAATEVAVEVGSPFGPDELGELDHWLTARWRLYSWEPSGLRSALAWHAPWPLHKAKVLHLDDELITAAGLPAPQGEPLVHWSPGVEVRIGWRHRLVP